jgi:hypothetical protein
MNIIKFQLYNIILIMKDLYSLCKKLLVFMEKDIKFNYWIEYEKKSLDLQLK